LLHQIAIGSFGREAKQNCGEAAGTGVFEWNGREAVALPALLMRKSACSVRLSGRMAAAMIDLTARI